MKRCPECKETFRWNDDVIHADDNFYHKDCVQMIPTGYVAYIGDHCIGEVDYEDTACFILDTDEYEDESE